MPECLRPALTSATPRVSAGWVLAALIGLGAAGAARGHHSYLQYSQEIQEIRGELVSLRWINPHPTLELRGTGSDGESRTWQLESFSSPYVLSRMGITREDFVIGSEVTVAGRVSRNRPTDVLLTHLLRADGTEVIVAANGEPFWSGRTQGGEAGWHETAIGTAATEARGLFRVWSLDRIGNGTSTAPFTAAARAARAAFDEADSYVWSCAPPGMPTAMMAAFPIEFGRRGADLVLRTEYHDIERSIHMPGGASAADQPASALGYSQGVWEEEGRVLAVTTTRIDWPWYDLLGTPQSANVLIEERFTLADDQATLTYWRRVTDPATFTEPAITEWTYLALGERIQRFDCEP